MEMTNLTELSEIDILQLQFNILEELKVKRNQEDIEINNDVSFNKYPVGRSKAEKSAHRDEIDDMIQRGYSSRQISKYLQKEYDENISHTAINGYRQNYLTSNQELWVDHTQKTIERNSKEYDKFRNAVLERDRGCQCCGNSEELEVHHALPFSQYNSIGADTNNGIVLCKECHTRYHSEYGTKRNANACTLAQFLRDYAKPFQSTLNSSSVDEDIIHIPNYKLSIRLIHSLIKTIQRDSKDNVCSKTQLLSAVNDDILESDVEFIIKGLIQKGLIYSPVKEGYCIVE